MRLVTFDAGVGPRLGAVVDGRVLDLAELAERDPGGSLPSSMLDLVQAGRGAWDRARRLVESRQGGAEGRDLTSVKLLAPIPRPPKNVVCLGVNYRAHLEESNRANQRNLAPTLPVFFTKAVTSIVAPGDPILFDEAVSTQYDWEAELGVVIGEGGRSIPQERALDHIFGYTCFNDVSVRDVQNGHVQWFRGKSLDGTCPFGPWIVTADEIPDPHNLNIQCRVNGVVKQDSNTSMLINDISAIIYHLSNGLTIEAGDLISTGTPSGVGFARDPKEFLKPGDVVEVEVERVGILRNPVVDIREA
jgi:2-keto-4-pentenoate hydratase/2-oxohepta-3-ene-1,7-dioic acid hydratase in catechol pathway